MTFQGCCFFLDYSLFYISQLDVYVNFGNSTDLLLVLTCMPGLPRPLGKQSMRSHLKTGSSQAQ